MSQTIAHKSKVNVEVAMEFGRAIHALAIARGLSVADAAAGMIMASSMAMAGELPKTIEQANELTEAVSAAIIAVLEPANGATVQ